MNQLAVNSRILNSLSSVGGELTSREACRPCDAARDGISIGEAAGFALLEREGTAAAQARLLGYGESSDAYHMSSPHPEGEGALLAMRSALKRAALRPTQIDYINLHGTGTPANDRAEDRAIVRLFGADAETPPCSATKGWTGHALGAAGIVEAIICILSLRAGFVPGTLNTRRIDPEFKAHIALEGEERPLRTALSNSFGFGGSNCALVFGRAQ